MKQQSKLTQEQQQSRQVGTEHRTGQETAREFATVEEALRYDAAHTTVPPGIAERLQKSVGDSPGPQTSWWKRLLGGGNP